MKPPALNRDHVRAALAVLSVAQHRDDLDEVEAMASAIETYLRLEEQDAEHERAVARKGLWRSTVSDRVRIHQSLNRGGAR